MKSPIALLATALLASGSASAANHNVTVGGNGQLVFTPSSLDVLVGDTVTFTNAGGFHNVASTNQDPNSGFTFRCAVNCTDNNEGSNAAWSAVITIPESAGHSDIPYLCEVHGQQMSGILRVTNPVSLQSFEVD